MSIPDYVKDVFDNPEKYSKFWVAFAGFVVALFATYFPDAPWLAPTVAFLTSLGVFQAKNKEM
jgi:hypothetical protein